MTQLCIVVFAIGFLTSSVAHRLDAHSYVDIGYPVGLLVINIVLLVLMLRNNRLSRRAP